MIGNSGFLAILVFQLSVVCHADHPDRFLEIGFKEYEAKSLSENKVPKKYALEFWDHGFQSGFGIEMAYSKGLKLSNITPYKDVGWKSLIAIVTLIKEQANPEATLPYLELGIDNSVGQLLKNGISAEEAHPLHAAGVTYNHHFLLFPPHPLDKIKSLTDLGFFNGENIAMTLNEDIPIELVQHYLDHCIQPEFIPELIIEGYSAPQAQALQDVSRFDIVDYCSSDVQPALIQYLEKKTGTIQRNTVLGFAERGLTPSRIEEMATDEKVWKKYPPNKLKFLDFDQIKLDQAPRKLVPIPFDFFKSKVMNRYHLSIPVSDQTKKKIEVAIDRDLPSVLLDLGKKTDMKPVKLTDFIILTVRLTLKWLEYEGEIDSPKMSVQFETQSGRRCHLEEYFNRGIGDCDKHAAYTSLVFDLLKKKYPGILTNVYMTESFYGVRDRHAWNSLIVFKEDSMTISYIDTTNFYRGSPFAMTTTFDPHFDKDYFLKRYREEFGPGSTP